MTIKFNMGFCVRGENLTYKVNQQALKLSPGLNLSHIKGRSILTTVSRPEYSIFYCP